jgi:subtilisin family serine protease
MATLNTYFPVASSHVRRILSVCALALTAMVAALAASPAAQAGDGGKAKDSKPAKVGKPIPGHYIVGVKEGTDPKQLAEKRGAKKLKHVYRDAINGFAAELTDQQVEALRNDPNVTVVEQDQEVVADSTQYMNTYGDPWGLDRTDQRPLPLSGTYIYNHSGSNVRAYVIDTGIQTNHPQFGGRATNMYDYWGGSGADCDGHGTHVAGTIGGSTFGVAKQAMLRGVRVLDCTGHGSVAGIIAGVNWVRANAIKPAVANISIGSGKSSLENEAVTNLINSGVFVSVSAGNDSVDACAQSPASAAGTFTVAASDRSDYRASFTNYGACVDGYAPGVNVLSAGLGGGSTFKNGTSMASPHVAGVIALAKQTYGDSYASSTWVTWLINQSTKSVIKSNIGTTPNRLLYNPL